MNLLRAFALHESIDPETFGGSFALPNGATYSVHDHLNDDGVIVTGTGPIADGLATYPSVDEIDVPDARAYFEAQTHDELNEFAERHGLSHFFADVKLKKDAVDRLVAIEQGDELPAITSEERIPEPQVPQASNESPETGAEGND